MSATRVEIRSGAYYDSVVLMQLQRALAALPGVLDAGVVMGTDASGGNLPDQLPPLGVVAGGPPYFAASAWKAWKVEVRVPLFTSFITACPVGSFAINSTGKFVWLRTFTCRNPAARISRR